MYDSADKIRVSGKGRVGATFCAANFFVTIKTEGVDGPEAKEKAQQVIELLHGVVQSHKEEAKIETGGLQTRFDLSMSKERSAQGDRMVLTGYLSVFSMRFVACNVAAAIKLHDALTKVKGVEVVSPEFVLTDRDEREQAAFQLAVDQAARKFAAQCKALGLSPDAYEVASWRVGEDEHLGKTVSYSGSSEGGKVTVVSGAAELALNVDVYFQRKGTKP